MANNRMILLCNVCIPDEIQEFKEHGSMYIAKWYPAGSFIGGKDGSYYSVKDPETWNKDFFTFLRDHQHQEVASAGYAAGAGQPNPVRIAYESKDMPILPREKQ